MSPKLKFLLGLIVVGAILGVSFGFDAIRGAVTRKSSGAAGGLETGLVGYWSFPV